MKGSSTPGAAAHSRAGQSLEKLDSLKLPRTEAREIQADFDHDGIFVYQAFCHSIADAALRKGTFGEGFGLSRTTWIKPSLGWILYRSDYATGTNQERILRIKLGHSGFHSLLETAVPAEFDPAIYESKESWRQALADSDTRYQWDPDRDLSLRRVGDKRALQVGIGPSLVRKYVNEWIIGLEDVTSIAVELRGRRCGDGTALHPFNERLYEVDSKLRKLLGMRIAH